MNEFLSRLFRHPSLLWKLGFSIIFMGLALVIWFVPSLTNNAPQEMRLMVTGLLFIYGFYRGVTFVVEYRNLRE